MTHPEDQMSVFNMGSHIQVAGQSEKPLEQFAMKKNMWLSFVPLRAENEREKQQRKRQAKRLM